MLAFPFGDLSKLDGDNGSSDDDATPGPVVVLGKGNVAWNQSHNFFIF